MVYPRWPTDVRRYGLLSPPSAPSCWPCRCSCPGTASASPPRGAAVARQVERAGRRPVRQRGAAELHEHGAPPASARSQATSSRPLSAHQILHDMNILLLAAARPGDRARAGGARRDADSVRAEGLRRPARAARRASPALCVSVPHGRSAARSRRPARAVAARGLPGWPCSARWRSWSAALWPAARCLGRRLSRADRGRLGEPLRLDAPGLRRAAGSAARARRGGGVRQGGPDDGARPRCGARAGARGSAPWRPRSGARRARRRRSRR